MRESNIAIGLDIGTSKVCAVVARKNSEQNKTDVIGVGSAPTKGLRKGIIIDVEETVTSISAALEKAERMSGLKIDHALVSVGGAHLESTDNKGAVAISGGGEITHEDEERTIEAASALSLPANKEVLHVIPQTFTVDDQEGIKDPVGMTGIRLEVNTHIIYGSTPFIRNLNKCIQQAGISVDALIACPVAASWSVLSKRQKELGCAVIDIGGETTSIAVFEEGNIIGSKVLPIGSNHITKDITVGLRTSPDVAERVKLEYGIAWTKNVNKKEEVDLSTFSKLEKNKVKRSEIAYYIEERLSEIFGLVKKELNKIKKGAFLPGGIVLTGGGAKMPEIVDLAKSELKLPVQIGFPRDIQGIVDRVDDPTYAVPLGLIEWGFENEAIGSSSVLPIGDIAKKAKDFFKRFLP